MKQETLTPKQAIKHQLIENNNQVIKQLKECNFKGYISLEWKITLLKNTPIKKYISIIEGNPQQDKIDWFKDTKQAIETLSNLNQKLRE